MSDSSALPESTERPPEVLVGRNKRGRVRRSHPTSDGVHHTRISGAWAAVTVAAVLGVALIDFIVENTRSVRIDFFGASGHIPVAVALLAATLTGAFVVLAVGIARTAQLRLVVRRRKRQAEATSTTDGS
jgi:uncharacterized integral membrane protein